MKTKLIIVVMTRFLLVFVVLQCYWIGGYGTIYDNYTLIKFYTITEGQLLSASRFHDPEGKVEVLKESQGINDTLDLFVPPDRLQYVDDFGKHYGLTVWSKQNNYVRKFEDTSPGSTPARRLLHNFNQFSYNSFSEITRFLETLALIYPNIMQLQNVGKSYEGRPIKLARLSLNPNAESKNPIIFIDAGIHGNEWVAPAMAMYLIHRLVFDFSTTQRGGSLDRLDWLILPVVNPDGYEYTRYSEENRLWKNTRSETNVSDCIGVDGNRNYGFKWEESNLDFCHNESYSGPYPFSEPETQIVRNIILNNKSRIKLYVSLHSYGQYLLYPFGFIERKQNTKENDTMGNSTIEAYPSNWKKLENLAKFVSEGVQSAGGDPFRCMTARRKFPSAGRSDDYAWSTGILYSYTMMLTKGYKFKFPESLLRTVLPQFFEGFNVFAMLIRQEYVEQKSGYLFNISRSG